MERLDFSDKSGYNAIEASIHLNRYLTAKKFIEGKKVLDVACGQGYGSALLKKWGAKQVIGVDVSEEALLMANEKFATDGVSFINHTAEQLPFEEGEFDVVVSYETIEHLDYPEKFLQEIKRVSKKDATIIVSCPNDPYYYKEENISNPYHKRKYTWYDFAELAQKYLGNNVEWYFGFATNGFMTIPQGACKYPEKDDISEMKMEEMLEYGKVNTAAMVAPDRYINHWNSNYYLGVWGKNNINIDTITAFPRETFIEPDDPIFADITKWNRKHNEEIKELEERYSEEIKELKKIYEDEKVSLECIIEENKNILQENVQKCAQLEEVLSQYKCDNKDLQEKNDDLQEKNDDLIEENRVVNIQERRTSALLEVANTEKGYLWNRINDYERRIQELIQEKESIEQNKISEYENRILECENKITSLENHSTQLQVRVDEYDRYQRSVSYKLMQPVRKIWDVLRFWKK